MLIIRLKHSLVYCKIIIVLFLLFPRIVTAEVPAAISLGECEKKIRLFNLKPDNIENNENGYSLHYKYKYLYPSKRAFNHLQAQFVECGWKAYSGLEFVVNDTDWFRYLKGNSDNDTVLVHRYGRTYINNRRDTIAIILLMYISKISDIDSLMKLDKPNNNMQNITVQFTPFNEEEYRKAMEKYKGQGK